MNVNHDHNRKERTGIPEVVLAEPKTNEDLYLSIIEGLKGNKSLLITRITPHQQEIVKKVSTEQNLLVEFDKYQRTAIISQTESVVDGDLPEVAILSGGTSDGYIVSEIKMTLRYFGIQVVEYEDIGVAGIHRHQEALKQIEDQLTIKVLIVVAGNEGALFSVISSQTPLPVIAVPTSIGYGFGGEGETALRSALQTCSPGIATVNIDNGFGAATFAKKIINSYKM